MKLLFANVPRRHGILAAASAMAETAKQRWFQRDSAGRWRLLLSNQANSAVEYAVAAGIALRWPVTF